MVIFVLPSSEVKYMLAHLQHYYLQLLPTCLITKIYIHFYTSHCMLPHLGGTVELGVAPVAHKQVVVAVDPSRPQAVAAIIINLFRF